MQILMKLLTLLWVACWAGVLALPITSHESGGAEHIVIINKDHPLPPRVEEVLERLALTDKHPDVRRIYNNSAFQGFAASMKSHCLDLLAEMSDISHVEPVVKVPKVTTVRRDTATYDTRANAPWGLQRISTASTVGGNVESLDYTYSFANSRLGFGADIYMIDTGIYTANNIFGGRAKMIWSLDDVMTDNDGHGTHTAGIAGGNILGVASNANLFGLKALDKKGEGWSSDVVGAVDAVVKNHDIRKATEHDFMGSVMSMSLSAPGAVSAMNAAIEAAIRHGIHAVVAAGNDGGDACTASPSAKGGSRGPLISVGAINIDGSMADFSNRGDCVDVYAPGVKIISSWVGGPNMIKSLTGTSMATPHVTGIVAYAMANETLASDPALMKEWLRMTAIDRGDGLLVANNGVQADSKNGFRGSYRADNKPSYIPAGAADSSFLPTILR